MYSTCVWKVQNISVCTIYHWNLRFFGFPKMYSSSRSMLGFTSNMQKCNTVSKVLASSQQETVTRGEVIMLCCHSDNNHPHLIHVQMYKYAIRLAGQRWDLVSVLTLAKLQAIFIFPLIQWELWGFISSVMEGANLFYFGGTGTVQCHQCNV